MRQQLYQANGAANDDLPRAPSDGLGESSRAIEVALRRFALVSGTTSVFDSEQNTIMKPSAFAQYVGKEIAKAWKAASATEGKRIIDAKDAQRRADVAAGNEAGQDDGMSIFDRYVLIWGTKEIWDDLRRTRMPADALKLALGESFKLWQNSDQRRYVYPDNLVFDPSMTCDPDKCINQFDGLPLTPMRDETRCQAIRDTLLFLCNGDHDAADWLTKWLAYPLQHPGAKMATAVLAHSTMEGSGKSFLFDVIHRQIYGKYGATVGQDQMEGAFNEWTEKKLYTVFEEVVSRDQRYNQMGKIKHQISGKTRMVNAKFMSSWEEENLMNAVFLSNEIIPFPISEHDRRMLVLWPKMKMPEDLRLRMKHELDNGGAEAWYGYLLDYQLEDFNEHTKPPLTPAKERLIDLGRSSWEHFLIDWQTEQIANDAGLVLPYVPCLSRDLYAVYRSWCEANHAKVMGSKVFSQMMSTKITLEQRCHWAHGYQKGQTSVFLPSPPPSKDKARAIGECIAKFRGAAIELKVGDHNKWGNTDLRK
ncbi:DUF5906 domain-containing protein [Carnimonas bestiolae]|uniref:DUF5906 domain-containing protein n=1 Tax=Carnimonas bestiolae TaxID=3402172 RepID=UPI003F4AC3FD